MIRAFRDTWKDGIHSYLSYLRDRLIATRDLLHESGSIFVQIGDENGELVRVVLEEVFGSRNFVSQISVLKTTSATGEFISSVSDYLVWFAKDFQSAKAKYRQLYKIKGRRTDGSGHYSGVLLADGIRRPA